MSSKFLFFLVSIISLVFFAGNSLACDCPTIKDNAVDAWQKSDIVFLGTASIISTNKQEDTIIFEAKKYWKGLRSSTITMYTSLSDWSCDAEFSQGETYVVFANYDANKRLRANICGLTALESDSTEVMSTLGRPTDAPRSPSDSR